MGALRTLLEADIHPDLLVGTSVGAVNATYLAVNGVSPDPIPGLVIAWQRVSEADSRPANYFRLALRSFTQLSRDEVSTRMRDFFISQGLNPGLKVRWHRWG